MLRQRNHKNKRKKTENIFEINKRLLFFNKTLCLSLINRKKKYGTSFYQEKEIQDLEWGPTSWPSKPQKQNPTIQYKNGNKREQS